MAAAEQAQVQSGSRGRGSPLFALAVGAISLGLIAAFWFGLQQRDAGAAVAAGTSMRQAPDFTLGLFDGSSLTLSEELTRGKPIVLNFWASWCVPCAEEAPLLETTWQRERDRVGFIGVNVLDTDSEARAFIRKYSLTFPNGAGNSGPISTAYSMRGIPETYFIARDGRIIRKWSGPLTAAGLDQFIGELRRASAAPAG